MTFHIRNFKQDQFQIIRDWSIQEHWNPGIYDYLAYRELDKEGFFIGELDGQPIGIMCMLQYSEEYAYMCNYLVKPQYRGKGYGWQLTQRALSRITAKNIGAQSVIQQQKTYQKIGFKGYHKTIRYEAKGMGNNYKNLCILQCKDIQFKKIAAYELKNFPAKRQGFLKQWISLPQSKSVGYVDEGQVKGYGAVRLSAQGYRIGPLFGDSYEIADQIFKCLIGFVSQDKKIWLDIPDINKQAIKLAHSYALKPGFTCIKIYTAGIPNIPVQKTVFAVTSIQFG